MDKNRESIGTSLSITSSRSDLTGYDEATESIIHSPSHSSHAATLLDDDGTSDQRSARKHVAPHAEAQGGKKGGAARKRATTRSGLEAPSQRCVNHACVYRRAYVVCVCVCVYIY
jgi:hypothetical protein